MVIVTSAYSTPDCNTDKVKTFKLLILLYVFTVTVKVNEFKSTVTGTRGRCFNSRVKSHLYTRTTEGRQTGESRRASQMFLNTSLIALQIPDQVVNR